MVLKASEQYPKVIYRQIRPERSTGRKPQGKIVLFFDKLEARILAQIVPSWLSETCGYIFFIDKYQRVPSIPKTEGTADKATHRDAENHDLSVLMRSREVKRYL